MSNWIDSAEGAIRHIFRIADPNATDEEVANQAKQYMAQKGPENDQLSSLLTQPKEQEAQEPISEEPKAPEAPLTLSDKDVSQLTLPSAAQTPSDYSVSSGMQPSPQTMGGTVDNVTPPPTPPVVPGTENIPPVPATPMPTTPPPAPTAAPAAPKAPAQAPEASAEKNPLAGIVNATNPDYEAQKAFQESERKKRMWGGVLTGVAGVGDAISNAASAFGAKGTTGGMERTQAILDHQEKLRKDQFDEKLLSDPNSEISQHYKMVLGMMMNKKPTDPVIANLSAAQIKQTMPEVEKFMAKELQMETIKAQKALTMAQTQGNERDRVWTQAVQTINQIRGDKPLVDAETMRNGAISAYQAIDNIQKEGRAPNQVEFTDLLGQLWKARTGGTLTDQQLKHMDIQTMQSKLGPIATYLTGDPKAITTPEATQAIKNFIIQSGNTADQIHDRYMDSRGINAAASRMSQWPEDQARLQKMSRGLSFAEATGINPKEWAAAAPQRGQNKTAGAPGPANVTKVTSQAQYDALPSGTKYTDDSGKTKVKK